MILKTLRKITVFFFLFLPGISLAQLSFIPISADYTAFNMNDSLAYVEFYLSFFRNSLQYNKENDTLKASFQTTLDIKYNSEIYYTRTHRLSNYITDTSAVNAYDNFLDVYNVALPFRTFNITLTLKDLNSGTSGEYQLDASIPGPSDEFALSEIQLASKIEASAEKTIYTKNGLSIIPHPRRTFDLFQPMLYFYVELNDLTYDPGQENTYSFNYFVTNEDSDTLKTGKVKTKEVAGALQAEVGGFNAISLPHGIYYLNIWCKDNGSNITSNVRKKFFVHKPSKRSDEGENKDLAEVDPAFSAMTLEELNLEFEKASYIAQPAEEDVFNQLDSLQAMRKFITNFWRKRDQEKRMRNGDSRRYFLTLCDEADARFSSHSTPGWKTDRGRILIKYGIPDEIERFPSSVNAKPYSIWKYYQLEGGSEFIFYDRMGFGTYELIHSTYYKELQNPAWESLIMETGGTGLGF